MTSLPALRGTILALLLPGLLLIPSVLTAVPQESKSAAPEQPDRGAAYYHYALAHLNEVRAMQFLREEYVEKALEEYKRAIEADPDSDYLRMELARLYSNMRRLDDAVAEIQKILDKDPNNVPALRSLGEFYRRHAVDGRGEVDSDLLGKAIEQYERILEVDARNEDALLQLANLYRASNEQEKAEGVLKRLLAIQPDSRDALTSLAHLYLARGDNEGAIDALEKVRRMGRVDPAQLMLLGSAYEKANRYREAAKVFEQVVDMRGDALTARRSLAHNLVLSGQYDEALQQYEILAEAEPENHEFQLRLSQIYRQKRRFKDAWKFLRKAQALDPDSLEIKYNAVLLLEGEDRIDEAIEAMQQMLAETEKDQYTAREKQNRALFLEQLGILHRMQEDVEEAEKAFRSMAEIDPRSKARGLAHVVDTFRTVRDYDRAREAAREAFEEFPESTALAILRATVLAETGDAEQGAKILKGLLSGERQDREIYLALAQVYEKAKRYDDALEAVEQARKLSPTEGEKLTVLFTHGSVLERAKRFDQAEAKFRELLKIDPDHASALNYLGYMLADLNKSLDEAHDMIQKALDFEPDNGAYLDSLGWVYYRQDKLELAERYLLRSVEKVKRDPIVHSHLGDVYFGLGKIEQAKKHWEQSLKEWERSALADRDPAEMAKLQEKLTELEARLASQAQTKK